MRRNHVGWMRLALALWDMAAWAAAALALVLTRYSLDLSDAQFRLVLVYAGAAMAAQFGLGYVSKLYRGRHSVASFEEATMLAIIVAAIGLVLAVLFAIWGPESYPRVMTFTVPFAALVLMAAGRFVFRAVTRAVRPDVDREQVIVYGAGNAGEQFSRLILGDPDAPFEIVGFIDDDPGKRNLHLSGAKVLGGRSRLVTEAQERGVGTVVLAIPTASRELKREISALADDAGLRVLMMPSTRDIVSGRASVTNLHELDVTDLLGRAQIQTNLGEIADYLSGKVVLVTGAGGSIGSELARQVHRFGPEELVMLDRDESGLHGTQLSIFNQGLLDTPNMVLCDIRDVEALDKVFADHRPDVIFHAAALKHLPLLEQFPYEAYKSNVLGTLNVLAAAAATGVETVVNISTDKAADPTCMLGYSKRVAERLTAGYAVNHPGRYVSVRFGNVLGSRGSVVHAFTAQIERGGPVTVTHPDVERYFMLIPEACQLVLEAAAAAKGRGEVMVLDMGRPQKIIDVAKALIRMSGRPDIRIDFTGLRPGEKLTEDLVADAETLTPTKNPLVTSASVAAMDESLLPAVGVDDHATALAWSRSHAVTAGAVD